MDLITLSDIPELGAGAKPKVQIAIGRLDANLRDPRYGKFSISQADVDSWKRNLDGVFGGEVSFDFDHSSDRGRGTKAAAWISNISQTGTADGSLITADAQFTKAGAKAIRDGDYKYTSPTFVENYTDEHGQKHGKALIGGALTNRPVLRKGMPTLSLSKDTFEGVAVASETKAVRRERKRARALAAETLARDSRAQMPADRTALLTLLDLPADADQLTILAAVAAVKAPGAQSASGDAPAPGTPEFKAAKKARKRAKRLARENAGQTMTLSAEDTAKLLSDANLGAAAAKQLSAQTFDVAWTKALSEGRAAPSQEETVKALFLKDPDIAIKMLDSFVRIVPTRPAGSGEGDPITGAAPLGMDEDRFALHTQAKALAATKVAAGADPAEAYLLAVNEINDRAFTLENPGI